MAAALHGLGHLLLELQAGAGEATGQDLALFVHEETLLPVLMPLAPASSLAERFPAHCAAVLNALNVDASFIAAQVAAMREVEYAKTGNRSVLGIMNQFSYLAEGYREYLETSDLLELSLKLAHVPCSPLYKRETFPDRELRRWILNYRANSVEEASKP